MESLCRDGHVYASIINTNMTENFKYCNTLLPLIKYNSVHLLELLQKQVVILKLLHGSKMSH